GVWTVGQVNAGSTATLTITAQATGAIGGTLTDTAVITAAVTADPNPANNTSSVNVTIQGSAHLTIAKSVDNAAPLPGFPVHYTITVSDSAGPQNATGVQI